MTALAPVARRARRMSRGLGALAASPLRLAEALTTPHPVDQYLQLFSPTLTVRDLRASVTDVRRTAEGSLTLTLRPTRQWRGHRAGQFVQLTVDVDGVRRTRCYSPTTSEHRADGLVELTVRAHPDGLVSQYLHAHARPGLVVGLSQADGTFALPLPRPQRVLLVSGGSGITPVLAMLRTLCDEGFAGELAFLHYAPTPAHVAHRDELEALAAAHPNLRLAFVTDDGADDAGVGLRGRFDAQHLRAVAPWHREAETFVCGPAPLMSAVHELFEQDGLGAHVHSEAFTPALPVVADGPSGGTVSFTRSATETADSGATLLEQAEAAGLSPDHGCRMGICFSCTQVRTSGCTRNILTGETTGDPDTEIQLCISVPVGDVAIDL